MEVILRLSATTARVAGGGSSEIAFYAGGIPFRTTSREWWKKQFQQRIHFEIELEYRSEQVQVQVLRLVALSSQGERRHFKVRRLLSERRLAPIKLQWRHACASIDDESILSREEAEYDEGR